VLGFLASARGLGQTVTTIDSTSAPSRAEVFTGYSFFSPFGSDINNYPYGAIHAGLVLDATFYLTHRYGIQGEASLFPKGSDDNQCVNTAMIGPVVRTRRGPFSPFAHMLAGAAQAGGPQNQPCSVWGWGLTGGIGVDYKPSFFPSRLAIRPVQFDYNYIHVDNGPFNASNFTGGEGKVYAFRISSGLTVRLDISHYVRPDLVCTANPEVAFAGEPITITGNVLTGLKPGLDSHYTWTTSAGRMVHDGPSAPLDTVGVKPGMYRVSGSYYQGKKSNRRSLCTAEFQIREPSPPTVACVADRSAPTQGEPVTIQTVARSPSGRPLTYSYSASSGTVSTQKERATLNTGDVPPGQIEVTCTAKDDLGQTGSAVAQINVSARPVVVAEVAAPAPAAPPVATPSEAAAAEAAATPPSARAAAPAPAPAPPTPPAPEPRRPIPLAPPAPPARSADNPSTPQVQRLCTLNFPADPLLTTALPASAKACLERAAAILRRNTTSTLSLSGEYAPGEVNGRAVERIISAADYLTKQDGIPESRLHMRLAFKRTRSLIVAVVPEGTEDDAITGAGLGMDVDLNTITWHAPERKP
jgi:hypothetical protein